MKIKKALLTVFILVVMFISGSISQAGSYWQTGRVTKSAWHDRYWYVEINTVKYTLMPEVSVLVPSERKLYRGGTDRFRPSSYLSYGRKLMVKIEGRRIYEIIVSK